MRAKYLFPISLATKAQLQSAGITTVDDVEHYEIRPVDNENKMLDDDGKETGKTVADVIHVYEKGIAD